VRTVKKCFGLGIFLTSVKIKVGATPYNTGFPARFVLGNILCLSKVLILESSAAGKMSKSGLVNIFLKKVKFEGILRIK
ncbi:MAG: hypothetical protein ACE5WD_14615, partial [Candidatus Aminicenantia bacterium]